MSSKAYVHSFAKAIPENEVTNSDLSKIMDTSDEWITKRSGIKKRYWVTEGVTTSDLAVTSARSSLKDFNGEIDCVIAATLSPDYDFPGIGVLIQEKLNLKTVPAYDLRNQCSGFLYGIEMARALVLAKNYKNILVVGAEVHSTGLDKSTNGRAISVLFGDGAGSCIVSSKPQAEPSLEILGTELHSDGKYAKLLWCEHPGSAHFPERLTEEIVRKGDFYPSMDGKIVFQHAVKEMAAVSESLVNRHNIDLSNIKLFVPHQANLRINEFVGQKLGLKAEQVFNTIQDYGNTTAATIPIGMNRAIEEGLIEKGDIVLSAAFGSGFTWGAALFKAN